jgi:cell division protease FtsH
MSDRLGPILYGSEHSSDAVFLGRDFSASQNYSDATAAAIDEEIHRLIDEAQTKCREILTEHKDKLEFVAQFLLAHETMDGDQFEFAMNNDDATEQQLLDIAEQKARESQEANERERERLAEEERAAAEREAAEGDDVSEPCEQQASDDDILPDEQAASDESLDGNDGDSNDEQGRE